MSRRLDVELTSKRDDGTYTWRAAGAKQPKGELDGSLLFDGASVGDVVRAEAEFAVDGVFIVAVSPIKAKRERAATLEILGGGLHETRKGFLHVGTLAGQEGLRLGDEPLVILQRDLAGARGGAALWRSG